MNRDSFNLSRINSETTLRHILRIRDFQVKEMSMQITRDQIRLD